MSIIACDRRTGRPEPGALRRPAVVAAAQGGFVVVDLDVGQGKPGRCSFWSDTGWDAWDSEVSPWRLHHAGQA